MSINCDFDEIVAGCDFTYPNSTTKLFFDPKTLKVFDENKKLIGKGFLKGKKLIIYKK